MIVKQVPYYRQRSVFDIYVFDTDRRQQIIYSYCTSSSVLNSVSTVEHSGVRLFVKISVHIWRIWGIWECSDTLIRKIMDTGTTKQLYFRLSKKFLSQALWWVDPGWLSGAHQRALSLPFSARQERKYNERLMGWDKDRGRSLTSYCHGQNRLD